MRSTIRPALAVLGIVLAVLTFLAVNTWATLDLRPYRLDLTQNQQYTLSPATRDLLAGTEEPITLRLYRSGAIQAANPLLWSYADRVKDLLRTYAELSRGRIAVEVVDPEPFSPEEDRAVGFGLQPLPLDSAGAVGYLGIAGTNSTDDVDVIPVLAPDREPFLEYDLPLVFNLAEPDKPVVALISGLPINGDPAQQYRPWEVYSQLGQFFDLRVIGGDVTAFDADVDLLLLVHPDEVSDKTQLAIDQFVLKGGKALIFLDPYSEAAARQRGQQPPGAPSASTLERLTAAWGVALEEGKIVGDPAYARQVQFPSGGRQQIVDYLAWLSLRGPALAQDQVITAELTRINAASVGSLVKREGGTTEILPLLTSTAEAQLIDVDKVATYPDPLQLIQDYQPGKALTMAAARVTGPVRSAFPDALPEGVAEIEGRLKESTGPVSLVIVADTDLLEDRAWLAQGQLPVADNANLVANALDYLAGSEALASLRGRDVTLRPFTAVEEIRRAAERSYRAKEQELLARLDDLQRRLTSLEVASDEGPALTAAQEGEIEGFRSQLLATRGELREVRRALRSDIDASRDTLRIANIAAMPLLVALVAIGLAIANRQRTRRRQGAPA